VKIGIEQAAVQVWCDFLAPIAAAFELQLVPFISSTELKPKRLVVHCKDDGEDNSMQGPDGRYFRKLTVNIALHSSQDDISADQLNGITAEIEQALYGPYPPSESLSLFDGLEIYDIGGQDMKFDKSNWTKLFTVNLGGHLK
jgi:hypothetical protein